MEKNLLKTLIFAFWVISKIVQPVLNQLVLFFFIFSLLCKFWVCVCDGPSDRHIHSFSVLPPPPNKYRLKHVGST